MPDQSSAATEHAILQEITAPLATLPDDPVNAVSADFPPAFRGYDRVAVDAYVSQTSQLLAELQATRSPEAAVRRALERVGEQISGILQRAHDTAEQITVQSRAEAEDRLEAARQEAARIIADAQQRLKDLDADTDRIWAERQRIVDDTRELARQLVGLTDSAAERFPPAEDTEPPAGTAASAVEAPSALEPQSAFEPESGFEPDPEPAVDPSAEPEAGFGGQAAREPGSTAPFGVQPQAPDGAGGDAVEDQDATARMPRMPPGDQQRPKQ